MLTVFVLTYFFYNTNLFTHLCSNLVEYFMHKIVIILYYTTRYHRYREAKKSQQLLFYYVTVFIFFINVFCFQILTIELFYKFYRRFHHLKVKIRIYILNKNLSDSKYSTILFYTHFIQYSNFFLI